MRILISLLLCFEAWCSSVDVNDVSYLWPPPNYSEQVSALTTLNRVVPRKVLEEILRFAGGAELQNHKLPRPLKLPESVHGFQNWKIVSMRLDPCAPSLETFKENPSNCMQEIRLVGQPIEINDWGIKFPDLAIHILFEVSKGDPRDSKTFESIWNRFRELKSFLKESGVETVGVPLTVHPGFKVRSFPSRLEKDLLDSLRESRLKKITFTGSSDGVGPWVFFQGLVTDEKYELESDTTLRDQPHGFIVPKRPGLGGEIFPEPRNLNTVGEAFGPSVLDLFYNGSIEVSDFAKLGDGTVSSRVRKFDIPSVIENPAISNRTNTDCFSCHASTSRKFQLNLDKHESEFQFIPPSGKTSHAKHLDKTLTNLRVFGWFGSSPIAAQRVVNESTAVADFMEKLFEH